MVVAVGCSVLLMWHSVGPTGQGPAYFSGGGVRGGPGPPGRSAGVRTKEVRESRGDPGPLEGGGPGLRLLVLGIPLWGARGDTGPLPEQGAGPGPYVW